MHAKDTEEKTPRSNIEQSVCKLNYVDKRGFGNKVRSNLIVTDYPDVVFLLKVFFLS